MIRPAPDSRVYESSIIDGRPFFIASPLLQERTSPFFIQAFARRCRERAAHFDDQWRKRGDSARPELRPRGGRVYVDIGDGFLPKLICELLAPLCRAGQRNFFA